MALLTQLAISKVAENIDGKYDSMNVRIPLQLGDEMFARIKKSLRAMRNPIRIMKSLNVTKVEFDEEFPMKEEDFEWLREQRNLRNFSLTADSFECGGEFKSSEGYTHFLNILKEAYNERSRDKLRQLKLEADLRFELVDFVSLRHTFPNIERLDVSTSVLDPHFIAAVSSGCDNLKSLDISYTNIKTIWGISRLKKLKVLTMRNVGIKEKEDLVELGSMDSLEVLDVAGDRFQINTPIFNHLTEAKNLFRNLRVVDCSQTSLSSDALRELCELPNLRQLSLLGTNWDYEELDERVLNCATLSTTLRTLRWYVDSDDLSLTEVVLDYLKKYHRQNVTTMPSDCIQELCEMIRKFHDRDDQYVLIAANMFLNRLLEECQSLSTIDVQRLIALFEFANRPTQQRQLFRLQMWIVFTHPAVQKVLESPEIDVVSILEIGMQNLVSKTVPNDYVLIREVFSCVLETREIPKRAGLFRSHFLEVLFRSTMSSVEQLSYSSNLEVLRVAVKHEEFREEFVKKYLKEFVKFHGYDNVEENRIVKLKIIREVAMRLDEKSMKQFCQGDLLDKLVKMMKKARHLDYLTHVIFTIFAFLRINGCQETEVRCFKCYINYRTFPEDVLQKVREDDEEMKVLRKIMSSEWPSEISTHAISSLFMSRMYKNCL